MASEELELAANEAENIAPVVEVEIETVANTQQEIVAETPLNVAEEQTEIVETATQEVTTTEVLAQEHIETLEVTEEEHVAEEIDYSSFTKKDFVDLLEKLADSIKAEGATATDYKNTDAVLKAVKPIFDELKFREKNEAKKKYVAENSSDEGFEFKNDNYTVRFEALAVQIRDTKTKYFKKLDSLKENNFEIKTDLLQKLRVLVEGEENGAAKNTWNEFKKIQDDWKNAGNVNSPHNATLWSAYNALVDRYFSIRNIQNGLKDLDRKKNLTLKTELVEKIEGLSKSLEESPLTNSVLKQANELLEEYKHIGPAAREIQNELWGRLKLAFDVIHGKRREQKDAFNVLENEVLNAKIQLVETANAFADFNADTVPAWSEKTKEVTALQEVWEGIKGKMPKEKGKDVSHDFWANLKTFFQHKSDFFKRLETVREDCLKQKTTLCEEVEALAAAAETTPTATNKVIEFQKAWKNIGHVPEKQKDVIFNRFKKACDDFFNLKRNNNQATEKQFEDNLAKKVALCAEIEGLAQNNPDLQLISTYKTRFAEIGFVPRANMQDIQRRFVDAINTYVKASSQVSGKEKEKMLLQNEVEVITKGEGKNSPDLRKKENDVRKQLKNIEDDVALWKNNLEFFARSKNADALRADFNTKIAKAEKEISELKQKIKIIASA